MKDKVAGVRIASSELTLGFIVNVYFIERPCVQFSSWRYVKNSVMRKMSSVLSWI